ncbi:sulfatase-like hydrolase/transferase [Halorussus halophilus]|uniref:sulfatase-like hydrolase/transferase n=1 Tax=Halorussus halophilus TaxID=2650975 RepID=UPI00130130A6|nr:sulfatase-like hydrolase/transferase [Halorussus halophilus]
MTDGPVERLESAGMRAAGYLPNAVVRRLARPYNRVQRRRADRTFQAREREELAPATDAPQHVLVVVVDALRADTLDTSLTPFLHERSVETARTPAPWTFPAVSSLFTGQYPHEHGAMRQSDDANRGADDLVVPPQLPDDQQLLSDAFAAAGYDTYGAFAFHMPFFALSGRFERHALYDDAPAKELLADYRNWLDERSDERTFAYLHLGDLHEPVDPPGCYWLKHDVDDSIQNIRRWAFETETDPGSAARRYQAHRKRLYRAATDYVDDQLRELRNGLVRHVGDEFALVVTGDHGEAFWEHSSYDADNFVDSRPAHCVDHGGTPYECLTRVPLVVEGLDVEAGPTSLIDIAPTLCDALGHPNALSTSGKSLFEERPDDRVLLVEAARYGHEKKAAYSGDWKLLVSKGDDVAAGFSLPDEDPTDLPRDVERRLAETLPPWPDGTGADVSVSGIARDRLEDLGYV